MTFNIFSDLIRKDYKLDEVRDNYHHRSQRARNRRIAWTLSNTGPLYFSKAAFKIQDSLFHESL